MYLDPTNPHNYNGFIHPAYISHIESMIQTREATISDAEIPNADAIDFAKKGILDHFSVEGGRTSMEALVIKGQGSRLVEFLSSVNSSSTPYHWLNNYYLGSPEESILTLTSVMSDPIAMQFCTALVGAICIQDLEFHDSDELMNFFRTSSKSTNKEIMLCRLDLMLDHYRSTPESIEEFELTIFPNDPYDHLDCAKLWAKLGAEEKARKHLELAEQMSDDDPIAWQLIALNYKKLLGDFERVSHDA